MVDEDARSFDLVQAARKAARAAGASPESLQRESEALHHAVEVPLETARLARHAEERLSEIAPKVKPTIASDLLSARALLRAAREGALANIAVNVEDLRKGSESVETYQAEVERLSRPVP